MAEVARTGTPSLATLNPPPCNQKTAEAAVELEAGDMVYLTSAGKFDLADGSAADALANWWGMVLEKGAPAGQSATAYHGVEARYGAGLTVAARYYLSATAGDLADVATTGGDVPCAFATGATTIYIISPNR